MRKIIGYIFAVCVTNLIAFYLDGTLGAVMLMFEGVCLALSLLTLFLTKNTLEFELITERTVHKNRDLKVTVRIKKGRFPLMSFVDIDTSYSLHFIPADGKVLYRLALFGPENAEHTFIMKPAVAGNAQVGISEVYVSDFLGILRLKLKTGSISKNVTVLPDVHAIDNKCLFLRHVSDAVIYDDDEEIQTSALSAAMISGYEHRDYVPGDSLKKVNWKISAKWEKLIVRLDEAITSTKITFIFDYICRSQLPRDMWERSAAEQLKRDKKEYARLRRECEAAEMKFPQDALKPKWEEYQRSELRQKERALEGFLSMAEVFINHGLTCNLMYVSDGRLHDYELSDVHSAALKIAPNEFKTDVRADNALLADGILSKTGVFIIYSAVSNHELGAILDSNERDSMIVHNIYADTSSVKGDRKWVIQNDFNVKPIHGVQ
ncbi:MAG: DUF58 domain-containing protein [Oscillospiraceae bacterium]|jgi:hypothetical protein|nr:DUF58 domain-containing protein [Oscillospiraceae bacterium]